MTTTKKILWFSWIIFAALIVLKVLGYDTGEALGIVGGLVVSIVTGFYMWKSKCENREKIACASVKELADKYGIEHAIALAEVILKD